MIVNGFSKEVFRALSAIRTPPLHNGQGSTKSGQLQSMEYATDALRDVADGVNALRSPERAAILVTHYQRLLDHTSSPTASTS